jgi:hypothetical protein
MSKSIALKPWHPGVSNEAPYDLFIATVGYETRARFVAESLNVQSKMKVACAFDNNKVHSYVQNLSWYKRAGYAVEEKSEDTFESWCEDVLKVVAQKAKGGGIRLGIDISSMTRFRIAALVAAIFDHESRQTFKADFLYAPASFSPPPEQEEAPIIVCKPVLDKWAGWSVEPENPTLAVFGLGYECDKALGALEYIEPGSVWAFMPSGENPSYDSAVRKANETFFESIPKSHVFQYRIDEPLECFSSLESLVYGKLKSTKPLLMPFGPKLFALNCILVACVHFPSVAVWRVSSGPYEPPLDIVASGKVVGMQVHFEETDSGVGSPTN